MRTNPQPVDYKTHILIGVRVKQTTRAEKRETVRAVLTLPTVIREL